MTGNLEDHPTVRSYRQKAESGRKASALDRLDAGWLKELVLRAGADDTGLVELDREELRDQRDEIKALFPTAKTLVSIVCRLNPENIRCLHRSVSDLEYVHGFEAVNATARRVAVKLREAGVRAVNLPAGFPMELSRWPGKMWLISHKTVAAAAGMGQMGHHRVLIHPRFGNFIVLGTILIDREATAYDRPLDFNPCIGCKLCVSVCPVGAIGNDGHFSFVNCMTHNYRDRLGGFSDWVEKIAGSRNALDYRRKVSDPETVSMWQSLSYGICNKSSYCMAVCPAGEEVVGPYLEDRKAFIENVVRPLQDKEEVVFSVPGSDCAAHVARHFPNKRVKEVGNGLRPKSAEAFLTSLPLVFQREQSAGVAATWHFTFTGAESCRGTVVIRDKTLEVHRDHVGAPDIRITADSRTWIGFLAGEKSLVRALLSRKVRIKGSPRLMRTFARCFAAQG